MRHDGGYVQRRQRYSRIRVPVRAKDALLNALVPVASFKDGTCRVGSRSPSGPFRPFA